MPEIRRVAASMPVQGPESTAAQIDVILLKNFADELQRRVPVGNRRRRQWAPK